MKLMAPGGEAPVKERVLSVEEEGKGAKVVIRRGVERCELDDERRGCRSRIVIHEPGVVPLFKGGVDAGVFPASSPPIIPAPHPPRTPLSGALLENPAPKPNPITPPYPCSSPAGDADPTVSDPPAPGDDPAAVAPTAALTPLHTPPPIRMTLALIVSRAVEAHVPVLLPELDWGP